MHTKSLVLALSFFALGAHAAVINANNPPKYQNFKYNYAEMVELANPDRLRHRIFYEAPSTGPDAAWFDAVKHGDLATVKAMVAKGQDIEAKDTGSLDQTALGWAAFIGDEAMVDYLLSQNASLQATDKGDVYNVLKSAALGNNVRVVEKIYNLMKDKVDLNDQTVESDGETLVMVAASNNRLEIVQFLLDQGSNPNLSTTTNDTSLFSYNQSALSYACQNKLPEMQKLLIARGAINHRTGKPNCQ